MQYILHSIFVTSTKEVIFYQRLSAVLSMSDFMSIRLCHVKTAD